MKKIITHHDVNMNSVNQKIIDLIISKAEIVCSDFLVFIGIYGSVVTVD